MQSHSVLIKRLAVRKNQNKKTWKNIKVRSKPSKEKKEQNIDFLLIKNLKTHLKMMKFSKVHIRIYIHKSKNNINLQLVMIKIHLDIKEVRFKICSQILRKFLLLITIRKLRKMTQIFLRVLIQGAVGDLVVLR